MENMNAPETTLSSQEKSNIFSARTPSSRKKIEEILNFMKNMATYIAPEEALSDIHINIEALDEQQIEFLITRASFKKAPKGEVYDALEQLNTSDIVTLNLNIDNLKYFITVIGAFFYARSVMRLISKKEITEIQKLLGDTLYKHVVHFGKTNCRDNYPIKSPFEEQFQATGYYIFKIYFSQYPDIIQEISLLATEYPKPKKNMSVLHIKDEYACEIVALVQSYLLGIV